MSYGLSSASYDVRINQQLVLDLNNPFSLASTIEEFNMPDDVCGMVLDKSSWARKGLSLFNTFIDPGFRGWLTLEMSWNPNFIDSNDGYQCLIIEKGSPIAQIVFMKLDMKTDKPYLGKYQDQPNEPVESKYG